MERNGCVLIWGTIAGSD